MYRFAVIVLAFFTFAYSQVVSAQAAAGALAYELFMAKVTTFGATTVAYATNGAVLANGVRTFSAPTFSAGGAAVATAARVAVGSGSAAVVVTGGVTGAEVFSAVRLLAMGGSGFVGVGLTAVTMAPMVINYFKTENSELGPLSARNSDKPFLLKTTSENCVNGTCYEYRADDDDPWTQSPSAACAASSWVSEYQQGFYYIKTKYLRYDSAIQRCVFEREYTAFNTGDSISKAEVTHGLSKRALSSSSSVNIYPASWDDIAPYMDKPISPDVFKALLDAGAQIKVTPRVINGPEYVPLEKTVDVTETLEKITTTEKQKSVKLEYKTKTDPATGQPLPYVEATPKETVIVKEKDKATGVEKIISTTEAQGGEKPATEPQEIETCGLPGKPKCLIDETGTPEKKDYEEQKKVDDIFKPVKEIIASPETKLPSLPSLNWAFQLPTGCTAISLPAFAPWLQGIDICPFLPMFHDIMSVIWVIGGLFGAIGTFWRNVFSQT